MSAPTWLSNAIMYEVYPQSFYDSNGDGIGDLRGIIEKLDYIKSLGCDIVWLNPCFDSPFQDAGYDIRDYYKVAPRYGTNDDLQELFDKAHQKGLKVILDLVAGHTSIEHPFFKKSAESTPNEYSNYYVWSDNWLASNPSPYYRYINGFAKRNGNYLINFFYCQPALNYGFSNPEYPWEKRPEHPDCIKVREMMLDVMKYYLNCGCDGFRVDMAASLIKGKNNYPDTKKLWQYYRSEVKKINPEAILVAEWSDPLPAVEAGFDVDFMIHICHPGYTKMLRNEQKRIPSSAFADDTPSFFDPDSSGNSKPINDEIIANQKGLENKGYFAIPSGNHDMGRIRQYRDFDDLKNIFAFLLTVPGVPAIYYGDEIGMDYINGLESKEGGYLRTGSRTPMQWNNSRNGGFSNGREEDLYLPIDREKLPETNVETQEKDENSLLNLVRKLIRIRKNNSALGNLSDYYEVFASGNECPYVFLRKSETQNVLCAFNPSAQKIVKELPNNFKLRNDFKELLVNNAEIVITENRIILTMGPKSFFIVDA